MYSFNEQSFIRHYIKSFETLILVICSTRDLPYNRYVLFPFKELSVGVSVAKSGNNFKYLCDNEKSVILCLEPIIKYIFHINE